MLRMATHSVVSGWRRIYDFIITIAAAVVLLDEYVESIEVHPGDEVRISWK